MRVKITYSAIYILLIIGLSSCVVFAKRSPRPIKDAVAWIESALMLPIAGCFIIMFAEAKSAAMVGCYVYFIGLDMTLYSLVNFTNEYCKGLGDGSRKPTVMYLFLIGDSVQLLMNPFFGHAFSVELVADGDAQFYKVVPYWGQTVHRLVDYFILLCVMLMFTLISVKTPKIYRGKYTVLLVCLMALGAMQAYFLFSKSNFDRSVIGYGLFGMVIFYFAIIHRPLRLLDQMLSNIISDLSDAFYVFDPGGRCIWANEQGCRLVDFSGKNYEDINPLLIALFGEPNQPVEKIPKMIVGEGAEARFYELEEKQVMNADGRANGSYLRVRDITEEEHEIQARDKQIGQISLEAYKDALTGVGNKAAYNNKVQAINEQIQNGLTEFAVVMVDINDLKHINDEYGHKAGDLYIKGCCHMICEHFKFSPVFRIGGDEFAVLLHGQDFEMRHQRVQDLRQAYEDSFELAELDPWLRYSAAVGLAEYASDDNSLELVFKRADKAMYEEKKQFKALHGSYRS